MFLLLSVCLFCLLAAKVNDVIFWRDESGPQSLALHNLLS